MFFQHNKFGIVRIFFILSNITIASGHQHEMLGDTGWAVEFGSRHKQKIPCISARDFSPFPPLVWLLSLSHLGYLPYGRVTLLGFSLCRWCYSVRSPFLGSEFPFLPNSLPWLGLFPFRITKVGIIFGISKFFPTFFRYATHTIL